MLTAWVGFHDVDETGGPVSFLEASHRWDVEGLDFFGQDLSGMEAALVSQGYPFDLRSTRMKRGQVSFHHCKTVHGSGPNRGTVPRRSLAIRLQPLDKMWHSHVLPNGEQARHGNDLLAGTVDGYPDSADQRMCPLLWSASRAARTGDRRGMLSVQCPGCGRESQWEHSRYVRHVAGEAIGGRPVVIDVSLRRATGATPPEPNAAGPAAGAESRSPPPVAGMCF